MKTKSIFTTCKKCDSIRLLSTPCSCKSYNKLPLVQQMLQIVWENQPISAFAVTNIINKMSHHTTREMTHLHLENDVMTKKVTSRGGYDNFIIRDDLKPAEPLPSSFFELETPCTR